MVRSFLALSLFLATASWAHRVEVPKTALRDGDHILINVRNLEAPADAYLVTEINGTLYFVAPDLHLSQEPVPIRRGITSLEALIFDLRVDNLLPGRYPAYIILTRLGGDPRWVPDWLLPYRGIWPMLFHVKVDLDHDRDGDGWLDGDHDHNGWLDGDHDHDGWLDDDHDHDGWPDH